MQTRTSQRSHVVPGVLVAFAGSALALAASPWPAALELSALDGTSGFVINGAGFPDYFGAAVSSAGDVNGDGFDDIVIGALGTSRSFVVFGAPGIGGSGSLGANDLDGSNGFTIQGLSGQSGYSVSRAGDVNGDGIADLIIGTPFESPGGRSNAGVASIVFGDPAIGSTGSVDLSALDGTNGFTLNGIDASDYAGISVSPAGDINGDGVDDVIIGASYADQTGYNNAGEAYVFFGRDTSTDGPFAPSYELGALNGADGFAVIGIGDDATLGFSVSSAGDVNGDAIVDVIIGAPGAGPAGQLVGRAYVVFGRDTGVSGQFPASFDVAGLTGLTGFQVVGSAMFNQTGWAVSGAGDVNNDGHDDVLIGAPNAKPDGRIGAGESYVVFGGPGVGGSGSVSLSALSGADGFSMRGNNPFDRAGFCVSGAGDVNGDGVDDVLLGAAQASPDGRTYAGESYLLFGRDVAMSGPYAPFIELAGLDGANGIALRGVDIQDNSGWYVSDAGDVNGDGIDDVLIGAPYAEQGGSAPVGEVYVVFGGTQAPACAGDVNGDGFTNAADFTILAGNFGSAVAINMSGDLNGDGIVNASDFVVLAGDFGCGSP